MEFYQLNFDETDFNGKKINVCLHTRIIYMYKIKCFTVLYNSNIWCNFLRATTGSIRLMNELFHNSLR